MKTAECDSPAEGSGGYVSTLELVVDQQVMDRQRSNGALAAALWEMPATIVGRLSGFTDAGEPLVEFAASDELGPIIARSTVPLSAAQIGSDVVLCFAGGDPSQPIVLGCLLPPALLPSGSLPAAAQAPHAELNGQRLELSAHEEIVLRCGKSSITLTQAGKILIRGEYLLSRSAGVNRIKGGSVQIN